MKSNVKINNLPLVTDGLATSCMDPQVDILPDAPDWPGLSPITIVVFWRNHGWHQCGQNLWCKHTNIGQATHAHLLIAAPGIKPSRTQSPSEFIDIFPTLCELTGTRIPGHLQEYAAIQQKAGCSP